MKFTHETLDADLLVVGGGIGGLMGAITAAEAGAAVVLMEKCHTRRSGSGATGNDHFHCYIPEVHGPDVEPVLAETLGSPVGRYKDPALLRAFLRESFDLVRLWEEWGVNMRPTGRWECRGHALPGRPRAFLKYDGAAQKAVLHARARKLGMRVLNHHPVLDLAAAGGRLAGALALATHADGLHFVLVRAKTALIATGVSHRLYLNAPTPACMFNTVHCPNGAGGQALGWRVGARLVNMELPYNHAGPKFFQRGGKATWIGVYRYPDGRPLGPFVTRSDPEYGDITGDIANTAFTGRVADGSGPIYMDCSDATPEQLARMRREMVGEGMTALLDHMDAKGIDPQRHAVEFTRYEPVLHGRGFDVDENGECSLPGLFAAGDCVGNAGCGIGLAAWLGRRAGGEAARRARDWSLPDLDVEAVFQARMEECGAMMDRDGGADWRECNFALQQIMSDYAAAGPERVRSANLLGAGLEYLDLLRRETSDQLGASTPHELMRCAEVRDLMDCAEAILRAALARRESRDTHLRSDYPFLNPLLNDQVLDVWKDGREVRTAWRPLQK